MHISQRFQKILFSRRVAVGAVMVWGAVLLGCMSISIGGRHINTGHHDDGVFVQEGKVQVGPGCHEVVHYPIPYLNPPNLEIDNCIAPNVELVQRCDHFIVTNKGPFARTVSWTARGVKALPPPLPPPGPPPPTLPPPQPLPVDK